MHTLPDRGGCLDTRDHDRAHTSLDRKMQRNELWLKFYIGLQQYGQTSLPQTCSTLTVYARPVWFKKLVERWLLRVENARESRLELLAEFQDLDPVCREYHLRDPFGSSAVVDDPSCFVVPGMDCRTDRPVRS